MHHARDTPDRDRGSRSSRDPGVLNSALAQDAKDRLSSVEKIYAELARLPKDERAKRIEDGARKEGKLILIHTLRGALGAGHVDLFRKHYPFLALDVAGEIGSQDAAERLLTEETMGRHLTDVIVTAVMDFAELYRRNFAARYPTPAVDAILPPYRAFIDPENKWIPVVLERARHLLQQQPGAEGDAAEGLGRSLQPAFQGQRLL